MARKSAWLVVTALASQRFLGYWQARITIIREEVVFRRGITIATTAQEHHGLGEQTVMAYILGGLPEYSKLKKIIDEYPLTMGDNMRKIEEYTQALERFDQKGF